MGPLIEINDEAISWSKFNLKRSTILPSLVHVVKQTLRFETSPSTRFTKVPSPYSEKILPPHFGKVSSTHSKKAPAPATHSVAITFVNDVRIRLLNQRFRKIDRATDILSFPMGEWSRPEGPESSRNTFYQIFYLGDLVISLETAARNAKRYRTSLPDELKRLLIHGTLHLLGYDHQKPAERTFMRSREAVISKLL